MIDDMIEALKKAKMFTMERYIKLDDGFNYKGWKEVWNTIETTCEYLETLKGVNNESGCIYDGDGKVNLG